MNWYRFAGLMVCIASAALTVTVIVISFNALIA